MYKNTCAAFCQPRLPPSEYWAPPFITSCQDSAESFNNVSYPVHKSNKMISLPLIVSPLLSLTERVVQLYLPSSAELLLSVFSSEWVWPDSWIVCYIAHRLAFGCNMRARSKRFWSCKMMLYVKKGMQNIKLNLKKIYFFKNSVTTK